MLPYIDNNDFVPYIVVGEIRNDFVPYIVVGEIRKVNYLI